jgi:glycosyltransferase involved in cell wall biosynthesis
MTMTTLLSINNYHYYRGGAETIFLEQNRLFREHDWEVVPFAMQHPHNLPTPWSKFFIDEIEFGSNYSLAGKLARVPKVIYSLEARRKLDLLLAEVSPDICHAHNIYHHISPSILSLLRDRHIPVVLTLHDLKLACPAYNMLAPDGVCERCRDGRLYNVLLHRCIKGSAALSALALAEAALHRMLGTYTTCVSRFVAPSRFLMQKLCDWGLPRSLFSHVPNFIAVDRYLPAYSAGSDIVYVGRLSREKGLVTLIRAAAAAKARVLIAGTGAQLEELRELATRLNADVQFLGYLTGDALHEAIRQARAVVLPSECYENAPMSILEAYALGKPVIGARIGGIPELLREGETGFGFDSGNVDSLVAALRRVLDLPDSTVESMGRSGRRWLEEDFTAELYVQRLLAVYREVGSSKLPAVRMQAGGEYRS